jgi:hypothetical protein
MVGACAGLAGCAIEAVHPWERGQLAAPEMAWETDPLLAGYRRHTQASKEAASGDTTLGGGGCGCR